MYASRGLKIASNLLQVGLHEPIWIQLEPKLAPSCLKLGPCWPQVGSNLAQAGLMLGPFLGPQPPLGQPKAFQTLPCGLLASQTPTRSKMELKRTSQTSNLDLKPPQNTPKLNLKASLPGPQLLLAHCYYYCYSRTSGMGRSLLEYHI